MGVFQFRVQETRTTTYTGTITVSAANVSAARAKITELSKANALDQYLTENDSAVVDITATTVKGAMSVVPTVDITVDDIDVPDELGTIHAVQYTNVALHNGSVAPLVSVDQIQPTPLALRVACGICEEPMQEEALYV